MDEQDERLRQLIAAVCQHPDGSQEWRNAMSRLLVVIQGLPEFRKYSSLDCPGHHLDALNRTWEWLSRSIRNFKPRTTSIRADLVGWIDGYLYWRIKDLNSPDPPPGTLSLDVPIESGNSGETITWLDKLSKEGQLLGTPSNPCVLSGIENYIEQLQRQTEQHIVKKLALYIEQDPEGKLRNCCLRINPHCNCQLLSQRLLFIFKNPRTYART